MKLKFFLLVFSLLFSLQSFAFKFSPMSASIEIKNKDKSSLFFLENDSDQPIAVQVAVAKREMDINGSESNAKIGSEISIFPTQLIIPANEKRSVKVSWNGRAKLERELAFRLIAEQLPIDLEKTKNKKASIKVLLRYMAALYITDDEFSSDVKLASFKKIDHRFNLEFENAGRKHQVLSGLKLKFEKNKKKVELKPEDLKGITGENILPQSKRVFLLPAVGELADFDSSSKVNISFEKD